MDTRYETTWTLDVGHWEYGGDKYGRSTVPITLVIQPTYVIAPSTGKTRFSGTKIRDWIMRNSTEDSRPRQVIPFPFLLDDKYKLVYSPGLTIRADLGDSVQREYHMTLLSL